MGFKAGLPVAAAIVLSYLIAGFGPTAARGGEKAAGASPLTIEIHGRPPKILTGASNPPLRGVSLVLGSRTGLGRRFDGAAQALGGCVERPKLKARLCVDPLDWPPRLLDIMRTDSGAYSGADAIIRYDDGRSSRVNVLFPAAAFQAMIAHLQERYGPPTEQQMTIRSLPGVAEVRNTIVRWKSLPAETGDAATTGTILEVRARDDLRHAHTDARHGLVMLYREGAPPSFTQFNTIDLMVLRQRRLGRWRPEHELDR